MKLSAGDLQPMYAALLGGECYSLPQRLLVDAQGVVTVTGQSLATAYPLRSPRLGALCRGVASRLGPDGALLYSSRLCGGAGAAVAPDGALYINSNPGKAAVAWGFQGTLSAVLRVDVPEPLPISLDRVANAFSGSPVQIAPATLVTLSGSGLGPEPPVSLDWNSTDALPLKLGGTEVFFDDRPARLLFAGEGRILCVTPTELKDRATVRVQYDGQSSNTTGIAIAPTAPALLTRNYPDVGVFNFGLNYPKLDLATMPEGFVVNQDGAWNDSAHPAKPGTTVTVYATGLGVTNPPADPGAPAASDSAQPPRIYGYWRSRDGVASIQGANTVRGLIASVCQVRVKIPDGPPADGVERLVLALLTTPTEPIFAGTRFVQFSAWSNSIVIYAAAGK
jgi:uncharacterized protein (TIGR03437 family)